LLNQIRAFLWLLDLFKVWKFWKVYKSSTCFTQTALKNPKLNILQICFRILTQYTTLNNLIYTFGMVWVNSKIPEPKYANFALDSTIINLKPPKLNRYYFGFDCKIDYVISNKFIIHYNMIRAIPWPLKPIEVQKNLNFRVIFTHITLNSLKLNQSQFSFHSFIHLTLLNN
jgi:hypothetical protein